MEQKGRRSVAFRPKERTGDGEVKATHSRDSQRGRGFFFFGGCFEVNRSEKGSAGKTTYCNDTARVL